jgi:hypothetical protein
MFRNGNWLDTKFAPFDILSDLECARHDIASKNEMLENNKSTLCR